MELKAHEDLISRIFDLFSTGGEAISFLSSHDLLENRYLLEELRTLCAALTSAIEQVSSQVQLANKLKEIGLNAVPTVERICTLLDAGKAEAAQTQYVCSFVPLFFFWERYAAFFLLHAADEKSLADWYEEERQQIRRVRETPKCDEPQEYRYDLSIVVLFYGNQKMTKDCLDAIAAYTKGRSYELITFDNGSDPETTAWCESLPHVKKIYYPYNMGSSAAGNLIFTMAPYYIEGKYLLYVSNDVIVTPRYDEILYQCMESDARIAAAVPLCNSASNQQAIQVPYAPNDMEAMQAFAANYNQCNPCKWADRARLFSILACIRPEVLCQRQLAIDPFFCFDMFADDDFSCALRRMGYRQVLCKDVFVHHYGSATIKEGQYQVMGLGRSQFHQKYGVDGWSSLGMDLYAALDNFSVKNAKSVRILAIDPMFGESVLALCNRFRESGCGEIVVDALTEDSRYLEDMQGLFRKNGLLNEETEVLEGQYDIAIIGCNLGWCADLPAVLHVAASRLKSGGLLLTQFENFFCAANIRAALRGTLPEDHSFLHDPAEDLGLRIITEAALEKLLRQEGMIPEKSVSLTDASWGDTADQLVSCFNIQQKDSAKKMLLTAGKFCIWRKQD